MTAQDGKKPRYAQRKRIFPRRDEIFALLDDGFPVIEIRDRLGLTDIPIRTFEKNVAALRKQRSEQAIPSPTEPVQSNTAQPRLPEARHRDHPPGKPARGPIIPAGVELPKGREAGKDLPLPLKPEDYM